LDSIGMDKRWTRELVEAATRVNYAQNVDEIHALSGLVSMAATGASSVKGGNYQVFEQFVDRSRAKLHLNTTVTAIERSQNHWVVTTQKGSKSYDSVIIASPLETSHIEIRPELDAMEHSVNYVKLQVTLATTTSSTYNASYFHDPATPRTILTSAAGARAGLKAPAFNSVNYLRRLKEDSDEWVVKIFSSSRLSREWLEEVFNGSIGWVYRKEWLAYPSMKSRTEFPSVRLADGLYYVNAFEPFMSTMETETIASRNIVDLLLLERYNTTICGPITNVVKSQKQKNDSFVYGWDC